MNALEAKHLYKSYHTKRQRINVLQGVSLQIRKGEMVAIMGPSGSGKSTLLHSLSGIDKPDSGEILVNGQDLASFSSEELALFRRQNFGMVFQDFQLLESLSVGENILLPMILDRRTGKEQAQQLEKLLELTKLEGLADRGITELSGGQKQRVAIARAFVQEPCLIFADEPTGNLDAETTETVLHCMADMNRQAQASMLVVTHDLHVASFCHRILRLAEGALQEISPNICHTDKTGGGANDIF